MGKRSSDGFDPSVRGPDSVSGTNDGFAREAHRRACSQSNSARGYFLQSPPTVTEPSLHSVRMRSSVGLGLGCEAAAEGDWL